MSFPDLRSVLLHVITETAVHAGHLDRRPRCSRAGSGSCSTADRRGGLRRSSGGAARLDRGDG